MKRALIIGASGGIGREIAAGLAGRGAEVTGISRSRDGMDITDERSVEACLSPLQDPFDLIMVTTGALEIDGAAPEKSISALTAQAMADQFALNTVGPALALKHSIRLMPRDRRSVFAALSARVGSIGDNRLGGWTSYRAAKSALNQVIRTSAIELARTHPHSVCVALHPGTVRTPFTEKYLGRHPSVSAEEAAANLLGVIDGLTPAQSGGFFDWSGKAVPW